MATNSSRYNADSAGKMILLPDGNLFDFEPESDEEIEIEQDPDYDPISDINAGPLEVEIEDELHSSNTEQANNAATAAETSTITLHQQEPSTTPNRGGVDKTYQCLMFHTLGHFRIRRMRSLPRFSTSDCFYRRNASNILLFNQTCMLCIKMGRRSTLQLMKLNSL